MIAKGCTNMKNEINTVIFDYGCVLTNPQDRKKFKQIYSLVTDTGFTDFEKIYYSMRTDYDQGIIDGKEYWKRILSVFNTEYSEELAERLILLDAESWSLFNKEILDFIDELKERNYKLAVLSNMPADILEYIYSKSDIFSVFDKTVFSCDLKLIKPDPEIYRKTLEITGCRGEETLFIDDRADNVEAALEEGINTLMYKGFNDFLDKINTYLKL